MAECNVGSLLESSKCLAACLGLDELRAAELWLWTQIAETTDNVAVLMENSRCLEGCVRYGNAEAIIVSLLAQIAGTSDDPQTLVSNAACFESCLTPAQAKAIDVYLLAVLAGVDPDPAELSESSKCFRQCVTQWQGVAIKIWLIATEAGVDPDPQTLLARSNCLLGCLTQEQLELIETWLICQIPSEPPIVITPESFAGLAHWWRADDLAAIGNGNPVGDVGKTWIDRIAGVVGAQAVAANRPTFVSNWSNGQPAVRNHIAITAPKDLTLSPSFILPGIPGKWTCVFVGQIVIVSGNPDIDARFFGRVGNPTRVGSQKTGADYLPALVDDANVSAGYTAWTGANLWATPHAVSHLKNAGVSEANLNNADKKVGAVVGSYTINAMPYATDFGTDVDLLIAEAIHYTTNLSDADLTSLYVNYLKPRYALP
jgi:hypothetical protein